MNCDCMIDKDGIYQKQCDLHRKEIERVRSDSYHIMEKNLENQKSFYENLIVRIVAKEIGVQYSE
jgi:hypothetical protein